MVPLLSFFRLYLFFLLLLLVSSGVVTATRRDDFQFPLIDIGPWTTTTSTTASTKQQQQQEEKAQVVQSIKKACEEIGFFAIQNHGVNTTVMNQMWLSTTEFFDLPLAIKLQWKTKNETKYPYGYERSETLTKGKSLDNNNDGKNNDDDPSSLVGAKPDLKETFAIGPSNPQAGMPPRKYPSQPSQFKKSLQEYYQEMEHLATTLLQIFATALELSSEVDTTENAGWFDDKMDHHMSALRLINYWETTAPPTTTTASEQEEVVIRAGAHTDYGPLTILKSGGPGLQVLLQQQQPSQQEKKGDNSNDPPPPSPRWVDVPTFPDAFVVNIGDLMQRWTNDRWVSTLHRVIVPPPTSTTTTTSSSIDDNSNSQILQLQKRRQSIAYFVNVNGDTPVETLPTCITNDNPQKYTTILAKDHLMAKHLASMGVSHQDKKKKEKEKDNDTTTNRDEL